MKKSIIIGVICLSTLLHASCSRFLEVDPSKGAIISDLVFTDSTKANAALLGIYANMINNNSFSSWWTTLYAGFSADELDAYNASAANSEFINNIISPTNGWNQNIWQSIYNNIYYCNVAIEGLTGNKILSAPFRDRLLGEAKTLRAFCYFYLTNLYGRVPLALSSDYKINATLPQSDTALIYAQMEEDLTSAIAVFPSGGTLDRTRANVWAAKALLARVYLYQKDWEHAAAVSDEVIQSGLFTPLPDLASVFSKTSKEAVWQLVQKKTLVPEYDNAFNIYNYNYVRGNLLNCFTTTDKRFALWFAMGNYNGSIFYAPKKYTDLVNSQYYIVLRCSEQILIRAEANAHLNKPDDAVHDVNIIRSRAGLLAMGEPTNTTELLDSLYMERQRELFAEWGHRWFDLKRTGQVDSVLQHLKSQWRHSSRLFPIPQNELLKNFYLIQNDGY